MCRNHRTPRSGGDVEGKSPGTLRSRTSSSAYRFTLTTVPLPRWCWLITVCDPLQPVVCAATLVDINYRQRVYVTQPTVTATIFHGTRSRARGTRYAIPRTASRRYAVVLETFCAEGRQRARARTRDKKATNKRTTSGERERSGSERDRTTNLYQPHERDAQQLSNALGLDCDNSPPAHLHLEGILRLRHKTEEDRERPGGSITVNSLLCP